MTLNFEPDMAIPFIPSALELISSEERVLIAAWPFVKLTVAVPEEFEQENIWRWIEFKTRQWSESDS